MLARSTWFGIATGEIRRCADPPMWPTMFLKILLKGNLRVQIRIATGEIHTGDDDGPVADDV